MAGRPYSWSKQQLKLGCNLGSWGPAGSKMVRPDVPAHAASKLFCLRLAPGQSALVPWPGKAAAVVEWQQC